MAVSLYEYISHYCCPEVQHSAEPPTSPTETQVIGIHPSSLNQIKLIMCICFKFSVQYWKWKGKEKYNIVSSSVLYPVQ